MARGLPGLLVKYEHRFHVSPTANQHDAIDAIELALADYETLFGHPLVEDCTVDTETGEVLPVVTIVTDNGGPFRSFRFEAFIGSHPELAHVRTRVRTPGQNGSRERGFGTLKYERLFIDEIDDAIMLAKHAEDYRIEYNTVRPHQAIAWNRPTEVHLGLADQPSQHFKPSNPCQLLDADTLRKRLGRRPVKPVAMPALEPLASPEVPWWSPSRPDVVCVALGPSPPASSLARAKIRVPEECCSGGAPAHLRARCVKSA